MKVNSEHEKNWLIAISSRKRFKRFNSAMRDIVQFNTTNQQPLILRYYFLIKRGICSAFFLLKPGITNCICDAIYFFLKLKIRRFIFAVKFT